MATPTAPAEDESEGEGGMPWWRAFAAWVRKLATSLIDKLKVFTGPMIVAVLGPQLLGAAAAWQVESWGDSEALDNALELAITPLAVLFALVFFLLEYNRHAGKAADDDEAWQIRTRGALSITGAWAVAATLAILVHTAEVPNWKAQHTASIAVGLTVAAFASLLVVPAIRHLLGQPDPQTDAIPRGGARLVDAGVAALLVYLVWILFRGLHEGMLKFAQVTYFISGVVIVALYEFTFTWRRRSLGKLLFGLRVARAPSCEGADTRHCSPSWIQAARRALAVSVALTAAPAFFYGAVREATVQAESIEEFRAAGLMGSFETANFLSPWLYLLAFVGGAVMMTSAVAHPQARGIYDVVAGTVVIRDGRSSGVATSSSGGPERSPKKAEPDSDPDTQPVPPVPEP